jgi:hypothetical protein
MIADALAARLQVQGFCRLLRVGELQLTARALT